MSKYVDRVLAELKEKNAHEAEFLQTAEEVLSTLGPVVDAHPEYEKVALLERMVEPERTIEFRVPWVDDNGAVHVNRGYWTVQRRLTFRSFCKPVYHEILRLRADFQKQLNNPADGRC